MLESDAKGPSSTVEVGNSGMCKVCLHACSHDYAPCPFCSPCEHVEQEPFCCLERDQYGECGHVQPATKGS